MEPSPSFCPASLSNSDTSMTAESSDGERSLLLELPKELRLMTYEYLLVHNVNLYFHPACSLYHCDHVLHTKILRTCRLVNTEATPFLCGKNKLVIDRSLSMSELCKIIMPQLSTPVRLQSVQIKNLSVHGYVEFKTFLETIQSVAMHLVYLQSLSIELDDVIMSYLVGGPHSSRYPKNRERLRKCLFERFHDITNTHPTLRRAMEVRYANDVNYKHGMHFRLLDEGVKVSTTYFARSRLQSLTYRMMIMKPSTQSSALGLRGWLTYWLSRTRA